MPTKTKHLQRQRFQAIEIIAYWEGAINSTHLAAIFESTSQHASREIQEYNKRHPNNLRYCKVKRAYEPSEWFRLFYVDNEWQSYQTFIQQNVQAYKHEFWGEEAIDWTPNTLIQCNNLITQKITRAIKLNLVISITYQSFTAPKGLCRLIHPHALVNNGLRWHVRAYDEKRDGYRDFNLNRIIKVELLGSSNKLHLEDSSWHTKVEMALRPHRDFSLEQQKLILKDYGHTKPFTLSIRGAMIQYVINHFNIGIFEDKDTCHEHQLVIDNVEDISPYLFGTNID